jgi:ESS family glutamate:Na+ symporter
LAAEAQQTLPGQAATVRLATAAAPLVTAPAPIALGAVNLALNGVAVAIGWGMLEGLRLLAERLGGGFAMVIEALPVFPLALVGSLLVRLVGLQNPSLFLLCTELDSNHRAS